VARLRTDALDALAEAAGGGAASAGRTPRASDDSASCGDGGAARHVDLRAFARALAARGHRAWLRTSNAPEGEPPAPDDADEPRTPPAPPGGSPAAGSLLAGAAPPPGARGPGSPPPGGRGSSALLAPPRHSFVVVRAPAPPATAPAAAAAAASPGAPADGGGDADAGALLVVDPAFREQFSAASVASACPGYLSLVAALPDVLVGAAEGLAPLVEFMCEQVGTGVPGAGSGGRVLGLVQRRQGAGFGPLCPPATAD
jgi:hypothetical protein